ncbi:MAG: hypothetical protein JW940_10680 [Polyangiaceae bacterium]|nr:hypothetical protein [Polyangiaceae bacterium]
MGTRRVHWVALGVVLATWVAVACADSTKAPEAGGLFDDDDYNGSAAVGTGGSAATFDPGASSGGSSTGGLPEEVEDVPEFELPHAGQHYVYAVNPDRDSVAVIDATTLAIHSVDAGDEPKFLQTLAGEDAAIVLNVKSEDATVIRTSKGKSTTASVDVAADSNAIAVAADGRHALVYFDAEHATSNSTQLESQSVSVLTLAPGEDRATTTSVGFRPSAVYFSDDGSRAFVITEDGVSILNLDEIDAGQSAIAHTVSVSGSFDVRALDVSVTRDGQYALAREQGGDILRLVDLDSGDSFQLDVTPIVAAARPDEPNADDGSAGAPAAAGAPSAGSAGSDGSPAGGGTAQPEPDPVLVTDVDLSPDNTFAVAAVRSDGLILKIPIPAGFQDPQTEVIAYRVDAGIIGSATLPPDAKTALLYTTADSEESHISLLDFETSALRTIDLHKSVQSVAVASDGKTALVVHQKLEGNPADAADEQTRRERSYGYSVVNLETGFARLVLTQSEVMAFTLPEGSDSLFVLLGKPWQVQHMPFDSFVPENLSLASEPLSIGAVPASKRIFVGQKHADGRITFIDWDTMEMTSVTGFELNSEIQEN